MATSVLFVSALAVGSGAPLSSRDHSGAIARVERGLRNPVALADRPEAELRLADRMASSGTLGLSVAVVRWRKVAWTRHYGIASAKTRRPVSGETLFQIASLSKPLTAIATLELRERRRIDLDSPVNLWLKRWKVPANEFTERRPPTIRHILSHTAGFTNGSVGSYRPPAALPSLLQALDGLPPSRPRPVRVDYEPGTRMRYSGGGFSVLQMLLEDVTNRAFAEVLEDTTINPLGMRHTYFEQPLDPRRRPAAAAGHVASGDPLPTDWEVLPEMAAGGAWSTADDMAKALIELLTVAGGRDGRVLSRQTGAEMSRAVLADRGLGIQVEKVGPLTRIGHTGSNEGYRSVMVGYVETGDGVVILTNSNGGADLRYELLRALAREYGWPGYETRAIHPVALSNEALAPLVGRYQWSPTWGLTFETRDGHLTMRINDGPARDMYAENPTSFVSLDGATVTFIVSPEGVATGLDVTLFGETSPSRLKRDLPPAGGTQ